MWEYGVGRERVRREGIKVRKKEAVALKLKVLAERKIQIHLSFCTLLFSFK